MSYKLKIFALAGVVAVVTAAYFLATRSGPAPTTLTGSDAGLDERIDALIQAQQAQSARLDTLEALLTGRSARSGAVNMTSGARPQPSHDGHDHDVTPEQRALNQQEAIRELESKFVTEPVSASWASGTERLIATAFSSGNLAEKDAPVPNAQQAVCRSFTCRIDTTYADELQADIGLQFLLGDIAARLPKARPFRIVQPDGSVQWVIYANTGQARR